MIMITYIDVIDRTLEHEKVENAIFSIIFVTNEEIHKINKEYRNVDRVTDVISFALEDSEDIVYNDIRMLGDIYICIPQMKNKLMSMVIVKRENYHF